MFDWFTWCVVSESLQLLLFGSLAHWLLLGKLSEIGDRVELRCTYYIPRHERRLDLHDIVLLTAIDNQWSVCNFYSYMYKKAILVYCKSTYITC